MGASCGGPSGSLWWCGGGGGEEAGRSAGPSADRTELARIGPARVPRQPNIRGGRHGPAGLASPWQWPCLGPRGKQGLRQSMRTLAPMRPGPDGPARVGPGPAASGQRVPKRRDPAVCGCAPCRAEPGPGRNGSAGASRGRAGPSLVGPHGLASRAGPASVCEGGWVRGGGAGVCVRGERGLGSAADAARRLSSGIRGGARGAGGLPWV